ncbi:MAG: ribosome small subunit-dependent GTPase A [Clostridiales bacterium]|nr:ribosome small subunit-dependent GTPase A [Clostridiales bacterium]MCF8022709.1 ribosome small subunit-dependent GTPase A [Clostridiales bacterium]
MVQGIVYKAYGGYYFVDTGQVKYKCTLRGRLNLKKEHVLIGDKVNLTVEDKDTGVIESLEPRRVYLLRPPVANIDMVVIIFSVVQPEPNLYLLDRFLLQARAAGVDSVICFNKVDLKDYEEYSSIYKEAGYTVINVSAASGTGVEKVCSLLKNKLSVFAGPSGVGKSSMLNAIQPGFSLKTGELSSKLKKGRHTTRHVELLKLDNNGMVADTPGFSNLFLPAGITIYNLADYYPEFQKYADYCRFNSCLHYKEPGCGVKEAVEENKITSARYKSYIMILEELKNKRR